MNSLPITCNVGIFPSIEINVPAVSDTAWSLNTICDGMPIQDSGTGSMLVFDSYDEAMSKLRAWHEWRVADDA